MWSNHFVSCCEPATPPDEILTVMCSKHPNLATIAPVREVDLNTPHWLQVCHDRNLINYPGAHVFGQWSPERLLAERFVVDLSVELLNAER